MKPVLGVVETPAAGVLAPAVLVLAVLAPVVLVPVVLAPVVLVPVVLAPVDGVPCDGAPAAMVDEADDADCVAVTSGIPARSALGMSGVPSLAVRSTALALAGVAEP